MVKHTQTIRQQQPMSLQIADSITNVVLRMTWNSLASFIFKQIWIATFTAWKMFKYGVFSGPYFPVFSPNTEKYGPENTPYLGTFYAVSVDI